MNQTTYRVIFNGAAANVSANHVRSNLAALFKTTPEQIEKLFVTPNHVLKTGLTQQVAERYRVAIESAGGTCLIESEAAPSLDVKLPTNAPQNPADLPGPRLGQRLLSWFGTAANIVIGLLMLVVVWSAVEHLLPSDIVESESSEGTADGTQDWTPPTSGNWTCDNATRHGPWQIWTLYPDGRYSYRIVGSQLGGHGQYRWNGKDSISVVDSEGGALNQEWMIMETAGRNWLMTNGNFGVYCHQ